MKRKRLPKSLSHVLVIDDDPTMQDFLRAFFLERGFIAELAIDGFEGLRKVKRKEYDLVLADLRMPGLDGLELLERIKKVPGLEELPVIIITAYATIESAIEATRKGAFDYITKPISPAELELRVAKALDYSRLLRENRALRKHLWEDELRIIGRSRAMLKVLATVDAVANSKATVLIQGESGTGKELIARALHKKSSRANAPFVKVNCAAIPETLLESELFGCVAGAYTDAKRDRIGKFEAANGGTLLLDEITETSLAFQAKLLRVLQEMEFERVGSTKPIKVDVRVIATTNKSLKAEVKRKRFREDLYYRLNVIPIVIPPLWKRKKDIPILISYFLNKYAIENGKPPLRIEPEAMDELVEYRWPGNVRELENFVHRAVVTCPSSPTSSSGVITREFVRSQLFSGMKEAKVIVLDDVPRLKEVEKMLILRALEVTRGNKGKAAQLLGITSRTIYNKLREYAKEGTQVDKFGNVFEG